MFSFKTTRFGAFCALFTLAACGSSPMEPPPPPPPNPFDTAEFRASPALAQMGALKPFGLGFSGAGVKIAFIDTGLDASHPEWRSRLSSASRDMLAGAGSPFGHIPGDSHGTWVAGAAVAARDGVGMHGLAFNAELLALRVVDIDKLTNGPCNYFRCGIKDLDIAGAIHLALDEGARVINISVPGPQSPPPELIAAFERVADDGALVVVAAGNQGTAQPLATAVGAATAFAGRGGLIVAGAVDENNDRATFNFPGSSNAAGDARAFTLFAPGTGVRTTDPGAAYTDRDGTSLSAPLIAGAAALMFEAFPGMSGADVADRLFSTAIDLGAAGNDEIFGHGMIDLEAAF